MKRSRLSRSRVRRLFNGQSKQAEALFLEKSGRSLRESCRSLYSVACGPIDTVEILYMPVAMQVRFPKCLWDRLVLVPPDQIGSIERIHANSAVDAQGKETLRHKD